ncbi:MAG: hypothetical protein ACYDAY_06240 [Candidatus Dormibacteria bacterium]
MVVVEHGAAWAGQNLLMFCIRFSESAIDGLTATQRTGLSVDTAQYGSLGAAVCQLDGEPREVPDNCLGHGSDPYWALLVPDGNGGWRTSSVGAQGLKVVDGAEIGWLYGAGANRHLPAVSIDQVCAAPASPSPRPSPARTVRPRRSPSPAAPPAASATMSPSPPVPSPSEAPIAGRPSGVVLGPGHAAVALAIVVMVLALAMPALRRRIARVKRD